MKTKDEDELLKKGGRYFANHMINVYFAF